MLWEARSPARIMMKFVVFMLSCLAVFAYGAQKDVRLGRVNGADDCGDVIHMHKGDTATIISGSGSLSGYCGVLVHAMDNQDYTCSGVCLRVNTQRASDCHSITTITDVKFGNSRGTQKSLSCFHSLPSDWCLDSTTVKIETIRDLDYVASAYEFNISVTVTCLSNNDHASNALDTEEAKRKKDEERAHQNVVAGVTAGICLAIVFLVVLFFTWCYYKNRAFRGTRYDYSSKSNRKHLSLGTFKAKFRDNKGNHDEEKAEVVGKKASKKKEENTPLVGGATGANASVDNTTEMAGDKKDENDVKKNEDDVPTDSPPSVPEVKVDEPTPVSEDGEKTENA